jgi:hypothetical protein
MPDFDALSVGHGRGAGGTGASSGNHATSGATSTGGLAGSSGGMGALGGSVAGEAEAGTSPNGGEGGANEGGANEGGAGPAGGYGGVQGEAGSGEPGGGEAGSGPAIHCVDGCAILYLPFDMASEQQFFTINLDTANGVNLSTSVLTAHVRTLQGSAETIHLYASALPNFKFNGTAPSATVASLANGGTLTMDLTNTNAGTWDNTKVISIGFLISAAATPETVQILVEDVTVTNSTTFGPWLFTMQADVNETSTVASNYNTPNILFANNYNTVPGARGIWVPPSP